MEKSNILTADMLDILFDGRNKEYGAYDLRRTYNKRIVVSITVMLSVCLLSMGFAFGGKKKEVDQIYETKDIQLAAVEPPAKPIEPPPPPAPKPPAPPAHIEMKQFTPPRIVPNDQVTEEEKPPINETLDDVKIGTMNVAGDKDDGTVTGPIGDGVKGGLIELPKRDEEEGDPVVLRVEIESDYPGGLSAWQRFLNRNLRYPQEAIDNEIQGAVVVQFIVDKEGNVSDVEAVSGPPELRTEAVRVIKKSGKWTPAVQNGRKVKSYKKQPIGFRLNAE
jgi:periplasmic protein TonB